MTDSIVAARTGAVSPVILTRMLTSRLAALGARFKRA
jgi:hypothetical protein